MPPLSKLPSRRRRTPFGVFVSVVFSRVCVITVVLLSGSGCHNGAQRPSSRGESNLSDPRLNLAIQLIPQEPRQMDPVVFRVHLADAQGHPVDGASVTADLVMPAMEMGKNTVAVRAQGHGDYVGAGRFSMDGDWNIVVSASNGLHKSTRITSVHVL